MGTEEDGIPSWAKRILSMSREPVTPTGRSLMKSMLREHLRKQEELAVKSEQERQERLAKIEDSAPRLRKMFMAHRLGARVTWSSLEVAFLMLKPTEHGDPCREWRSYNNRGFQAAIEEQFPLDRRNPLTLLHKKVLTHFNAQSDQPINLPAAMAAKYLLDQNLPYLTRETFPEALLEEMDIGTKEGEGAIRWMRRKYGIDVDPELSDVIDNEQNLAGRESGSLTADGNGVHPALKVNPGGYGDGSTQVSKPKSKRGPKFHWKDADLRVLDHLWGGIKWATVESFVIAHRADLPDSIREHPLGPEEGVRRALDAGRNRGIIRKNNGPRKRINRG